MPPRAAAQPAASDPLYQPHLWALVQMVMSRGCMTEADAQREFARITGKPEPGLLAQAIARENLELGRMSLALRRVVSPLTGCAHVGLANLSADAPAKAVGSRYSHAQREYFARALELIATDPDARGGKCSASANRLLNMDLSRPSTIGAGMAVAAAAAAEPASGAAAGAGKGKKKAAGKGNAQSDDADEEDDNAGGGGGGAAATGADADADAARRAAQEDDAEARRRSEAEAAARLAADAVRRMGLRERTETLRSLVHEGWLELLPGAEGRYCVGPRSFLELSTYLLKMDLADDTRDAWEGIVG